MSEENNNFTDSDPCPDEQELKSYASGEMAGRRFGRIIGCHLEFCPSCRSRVEKIRKTEVAVDEAVKVFAERLRRQQEKLVVERWRGPNPGTLWRTVPESDEELLGPMVIVIQVNESGSLSVAEISEDIAQAIHTDMVLEPQASGLRFRFMVRAGNVFETTAECLKTFAGQLPSALTNKVVEFCGSAENFDSEIPLSKYKFGHDPNGTVLMHRKGITSGMLVTQENDPRLTFLDSAKQRCSYLHYDDTDQESEWVIDELPLDLEFAPAAESARPSYSQSGIHVGDKHEAASPTRRRPLARKILALFKKVATTIGEWKVFKSKIARIQAENAELKKRAAELLAQKDEATQKLKEAWQRLKSVHTAPVYRAPVYTLPATMEAELDLGEYEDFDFTGDDWSTELLIDAKKGKEILQAAQSGDLGLLRELVRIPRSANFSDEEHGTEPLHLAALNGHLGVAQFLLDKGARIDSPDKEGKTSLILAAAGGHLDVVQLLLKQRANCMLSDNGGRTALYWALANGHKEIAEILRSSVK